MDSAAEDRQALVRQSESFLDPVGDGPYIHKLAHEVLTQENVQSGKLRLRISLEDVQNFSHGLHRRLITDPRPVISALETVIETIVASSCPEKWQTVPHGKQIKVGIVGELGKRTVSPRDLTSAFISQLVRVEGVAVKVALPQTFVRKLVQYCEKTRQFSTTVYHDATSYNSSPTSTVYPQFDDQGNPLTTETGLSEYKDRQTVVLQQLPEDGPAGQLPQFTTVSFPLVLLTC